MNRRQREKLIPSIWIMASKQTEGHAYYALYAIDWKRGGRLSWEGWNHLEDLLQFHIPSNEKPEEGNPLPSLPQKLRKEHSIFI